MTALPPRFSFFLSPRFKPLFPALNSTYLLLSNSLFSTIMKRRHPKSTLTTDSAMTAEEELPKPPSLQADSIYSCMDSILSPLPPECAAMVRGGAALIKKLGVGFLGAAYLCTLLVAVMAVAAAVGMGLVRTWVEEPVVTRERLHFDYTDAHPKAMFWFGGDGGFGEVHHHKMNKNTGVPVGHTFHVSLVLLMPESGFNRDIGVFQLSAEVLSGNGNVIAKSSQPCMLRFRSLPIRLAQTFVKGIPILLGMSSETQVITIQMLKHKEGYPRSEAIRVTLSPRAWTSSLPQLYGAEIVINSQLPWLKQFVHNWKWTFYVWTSLYVYSMFLLLIICCFKPILLPTKMRLNGHYSDRNETVEDSRETRGGRDSRDEREASELLTKWRQSRNKRKAMYLHEAFAENIGSSAPITSTVTITSTAGVEDEIGDSESVCLGG